ncbi:MAG TPA: hypothetical protein DDX29_09255 [Clostridiales bacterium]|nr:hypothetical protein [Clostridiales bacterium]
MKKSKTGYEKHLTTCPHCNRDVLDHMAVCPFCQGKLEPYYKPMETEKARRVRNFLTIVLMAIALVIILSKLI